MVNWIIILVGIVAIFVASKIIHFNHWKHRIITIALIVLALFIYASFSAVTSSHHLDVKTAKGVFEASKIYVMWLGQAFSNLKSLTGNAVHMDWMPKNVSITSIG